MEPLPEPHAISITSSQEDVLRRRPFLNAFSSAASTPSDALFASPSSAAAPLLLPSLPPAHPHALPPRHPRFGESRSPGVPSDRNSPPASFANLPADLSEHRSADDPPRDFAALRRKLPAWMQRETPAKDWRGPLLLYLSSQPRESQHRGFPADFFDVVKMLAGNREIELEGGDDILEVAEKKLGIRFPPPKWRPPGGYNTQVLDSCKEKEARGWERLLAGAGVNARARFGAINIRELT